MDSLYGMTFKSRGTLTAVWRVGKGQSLFTYLCFPPLLGAKVTEEGYLVVHCACQSYDYC